MVRLEAESGRNDRRELAISAKDTLTHAMASGDGAIAACPAAYVRNRIPVTSGIRLVVEVEGSVGSFGLFPSASIDVARV